MEPTWEERGSPRGGCGAGSEPDRLRPDPSSVLDQPSDSGSFRTLRAPGSSPTRCFSLFGMLFPIFHAPPSLFLGPAHTPTTTTWHIMSALTSTPAVPASLSQWHLTSPNTKILLHFLCSCPSHSNEDCRRPGLSVGVPRCPDCLLPGRGRRMGAGCTLLGE